MMLLRIKMNDVIRDPCSEVAHQCDVRRSQTLTQIPLILKKHLVPLISVMWHHMFSFRANFLFHEILTLVWS
jgi:hypothetical protein